MNPIAKFLVVTGILLIVGGLFWQFAGRWLPLGRLPGDIVVEKEHVKFYFPIVTCIVISLVISAISYLFRLFR